ncbi:RuBisCO large subunit C-terminal-like domain-containing protein [Pseudogemmatithrix spongiicola]|uniref:RuBisCO large subunit C-terminal-like domain-containing protein n=1 Tax=Pseudogemmatithrix spongiicola TaxID=3062599 RepID=A0AA49Q807_9BACT|nr:RuBisCO large subunit C-terminal-like domain-containing protein [Gemmatimonadaceae bacterium 'strain 138']WKW16288.1 RuBisCO large subunit C-terminal-like domain-containing protein [Gemmatimonadaceae bacterium 'strain 318']
MRPTDIDAFFADRHTLDAAQYLELDYTFECGGDPRAAAAHLCAEQSTAQWQRVGVDEDYRPRHAAKVIALEAEPIAALSLPVPGAPAGPLHRVRVTVAHPHGNFGPRIPNLLSAVLGEGVYHVPGVPVIRLDDIRFPDAYLAQFPGPQFGVAGLRQLLDAHDRPIFLGVVKPNIGLTPAAFAAIAEEAWLGGLDIAKDDEMLADIDWSPLAERAQRMGEARARAERATGARKLYMANVTDEVSRIRELHDVAVSRGAGALLVNALPVGLSGLRMLREHARVPLFAHFPMVAALTRVPGYGVHARVLTKLQRLCGADAVIMPGFGDRMMVPEDEVMANVRACLEPMGPIQPALPVPGGSDSAETLPRVYATIGTRDFGFVCGRGIFGHADGPRGGAASVRAAWTQLAT